MHNPWIYILIMATVTYVIRVLPMILLRKPINNIFIKSFLYYVPYITLAIMTFPAIIEACESSVAAYISLIVGIIAAYKKVSLIGVASICCLVVLFVESVVL